jgi:hypothetical protein
MSTNKYGPNTVQVELFMERLKVLTDEEVERIAARDVARDAAREAAWDAAREAAWEAARDAVWDAAWNTAWDAAWDAAWDVAWATSRTARAIVVMDLITEEQFTILTEPLAEILVELGIVWEGK